MSDTNLERIYRPLHSWQTRLVELLPVELDSHPRCNLHIADVITDEGLGLPEQSRVQRYEAISYSWGWPELTAQIECNSKSLAIPPPLKDALSALCQNQPRWLWCDAICIAQHDPVEKSKQVQMMFKIFQKAERTIAWLGKPDLTLVQAFSAVHVWSQSVGADAYPVGADDMRAAEQVMNRPWFSRIWIRQEVVASRRLTLQSGGNTIPFTDLFQFVQSQHDNDDEAVTIPQTAMILYEGFKQPLSDIIRGDRETIMDLRASSSRYVQTFLRCCCDGGVFNVTDNRDRIYSLLGIINIAVGALSRICLDAMGRAAWPSSLPIDYSRSLGEIFQDVVKFLINVSGRLEPIHVLRRRPVQSSKEFPSWIVDWRRDYAEPRFRGHTDYETTNPHIFAQAMAMPQQLDQIGELTLAGCIVARLSGPSGSLVPKFIGTDDYRFSASTILPYEHSAYDKLVQQDLQALVLDGYFCCKPIEVISEHLERPPLWLSGGVFSPAYSKPGDLVVSFRGSESIFLIRPTSNDANRYYFVSACCWWTTHRGYFDYHSNRSTIRVFDSTGPFGGHLNSWPLDQEQSRKRKKEQIFETCPHEWLEYIRNLVNHMANRIAHPGCSGDVFRDEDFILV